MQTNKYTLTEVQGEMTSDYLDRLKQENQRLFLENTQLKSSLEKEEFLHKNLYRQWLELNARVSIKNREPQRTVLKRNLRRNFYRYSFYSLLFISITLVYYLLQRGKPTALPQPRMAVTAVTDSPVRAAAQAPQQQNLPAENTAPEKTSTIPPQQDEVANIQPSQTNVKEADKNSGKYRVKTKTFFYNKPDESTQRGTFLLPYKDSYGQINAIDDQNGFIYIVYRNHAGRTSKGWIRKLDLDPMDQ